jgi:hypothetical protein
MSRHVKQLGQFYGADEIGIVALPGPLGFAIVCTVRADHDTRTAAGIGGQTPAMKGLFATFTLGAYIRELGYTADSSDADRELLAAAAGLGTFDGGGRFVGRRRGRKVHVADVLLTDLPLEADGQA